MAHEDPLRRYVSVLWQLNHSAAEERSRVNDGRSEQPHASYDPVRHTNGTQVSVQIERVSDI